MPDHDDLLTTARVAALLAVSARTVTRYAAAGRLVPVHIGRTVRYRRGEVVRLAGAGDTRTRVPGDGDTSGQAAGRPDTSGADTSGQDTPDMAALAVEALRAELAALRADNAALHREVVEQAAAAGLWQGRAHTLDAQLRQLTAPHPQAGTRTSPQAGVEATPDAPGAAEGPRVTSPITHPLAAPRGCGDTACLTSV